MYLTVSRLSNFSFTFLREDYVEKSGEIFARGFYLDPDLVQDPDLDLDPDPDQDPDSDPDQDIDPDQDPDPDPDLDPNLDKYFCFFVFI